jgi:hypothetical protein
MCTIPTSAETGAAFPKHLMVGRRPRKGPSTPTTFWIGSPENEPDIEAACDGPVGHVE